MRTAALFCCLVGIFLSAANVEAAPFEFREGDRVVFLGNTLIEREQSYGYWELALTLAAPEKKLTFRNLGWSGDTVWCESRGIFDQPQQGYDRTLELVRELKPTVIVLGYGGNEAFAGPAGLESFLQQYRKLLDDLKSTQARLVFLSPLPLEKQGPAYPDPAPYNSNVEIYSKAIAELAEQRSGAFVPLSRPPASVSNQEGQPQITTDNGQHYTAWGYWATANQLRDVLVPAGNKVDLPMPSMADAKALPEGRAGEIESIRRMIVRKDELYFHRWRPQNVTYLFLFRKHEQGNNAVEIPQFDPLVESLETKIHDAATKVISGSK